MLMIMLMEQSIGQSSGQAHMYRLPIAAIAFASVISAMQPALAADLPVYSPKATAPAQTQTASSNWSGGQLGGSNGVSSVNNNFAEPGAYVCPTAFAFGVTCFETPFSFGSHPVSYTVGPFAGYRWQLGAAVVGVEADWSWKKGESSETQTMPFVCFDGPCLNYRADMKYGSVSQNWDSSLRFRFGYLVTPATLLYGTVGVAVGEISGSFSYTGTIFSNFDGTSINSGTRALASYNWTDDKVGGTVGVGVETAIAARWKIRVEYRYTDYGSYTKNAPVTTICGGFAGCSAPSANATINLRESFQTVRVGLGYDF